MPKSRSHRMASRQAKLNTNAKKRSHQDSRRSNPASSPLTNLGTSMNEVEIEPVDTAIGTSKASLPNEHHGPMSTRSQSAIAIGTGGSSLGIEVARISSVMVLIGIAFLVLEFVVGFGA